MPTPAGQIGASLRLAALGRRARRLEARLETAQDAQPLDLPLLSALLAERHALMTEIASLEATRRAQGPVGPTQAA
jgi:hypothetical protein